MGNSMKNNLVYRRANNKYYVKDDEIDINNKNCAPTIIANQVKNNSIILDVGCAQGTLGYYLSKHKNCKTYGIEIDNESRNIAKEKKCYEKIYSCSIENEKDKEYQELFSSKIQFDYIIFADVLEHLYRPDKVIFEFQKLLKQNGEILVSIPNVAHYDIIRGLFNDQFNYSKVGILDNTHIRFFTKKSFAQFIDDINDYYKCNLDLKYINSSIIIPEYSPKYNELNKVIYLKDNINVLQNIFSIKKTSKSNLSNLKKLLNEKNIDIFEILNQKMIEYQEKDKIILDKQFEINKLIMENEATNNKLKCYENDKLVNLVKKIRSVFKG